eukprot:gene1066-7211_t
MAAPNCGAGAVHCHCFKDCDTADLRNGADPAYSAVPPASASCDADGIQLPTELFLQPPTFPTATGMTVEFVARHAAGSDPVSRELHFAGTTGGSQGALIVNSENYPDVRVEVHDSSGAWKCRVHFDGIYSKTEYVHVTVTVDGTEVKLFKNGAQLCPRAGGTTGTGTSDPDSGQCSQSVGAIGCAAT